MDASLRIFVSQFVGAVAAGLMLVIMVAFLAVPQALGGHPSEPRPAGALPAQHMT